MPDRTQTELEISVLMEEIAARVVSGMDPDQVARKLDIDPVFLQRVVGEPEFQEILERLDPEAAQVWRETKAEEFSQKRIRQMAREDGPVYYHAMKSIALDGDLRDETRAAVLEKLLKLGGFFKETEMEAQTKLSPTQIQVILDATKEMDEQP